MELSAQLKAQPQTWENHGGNSGLKRITLVFCALQIFASYAAAQSLSLSKTGLTFSAFQGGDAPAAQSFSATSSTGEPLAFSARANGGFWLSVQPAGGSTPA